MPLDGAALRKDPDRTLAALWPRLKALIPKSAPKSERAAVQARVEREFARLHDLLNRLYGQDYDLGINAFEHRRFLNALYTGHFPGSFARGLPFNYNPETQDMRISGMAASLIGVEEALQEAPMHLQGERLLDDALARLELIHAVTYSAGGFPLVYLGDEIGMTNDYRYRRDPVTAGDSRFAHRPEFDWDRAAERETPGTIPHRLVHALARFAQLRAATPALGDTPTAFFHAGNDHVFTFQRGTPETGLLTVVANLSEHGLAVPSPWLAHDGTDLLSGERVIAGMMLRLALYQVRWIAGG
ncbi:MAG: hypothetical protein AAGG50_03465 [Bacteroidota bacterium]